MDARHILLSLAAGAAVAAMAATGATEAWHDVLDTPAMKSPLAARSLLNGLARAGNRIVAVGQRGHIVYSDDAGKSWQQADVPASSDLVAVYFADRTGRLGRGPRRHRAAHGRRRTHLAAPARRPPGRRGEPAARRLVPGRAQRLRGRRLRPVAAHRRRRRELAGAAGRRGQPQETASVRRARHRRRRLHRRRAGPAAEVAPRQRALPRARAALQGHLVRHHRQCPGPGGLWPARQRGAQHRCRRELAGR